jgi:hypothetical protein
MRIPVNITKTKFLIAAVLAASILCTTSVDASVYQQRGVKSLDPASVAVIEDDPSCPQLQCLIVRRVDGKWRGIGWFRRYELLPGVRTIEFTFFGFDRSSRGTTVSKSDSDVVVEFEARPGVTYLMRANVAPDKESWRPEIFEKDSGAVVSHVVTP